jgi:hypothetical protein
LAHITRNIVPFLGRSAPPPIAFDQLELILEAHVAQRFGGTKQRRATSRGGLSAWQRMAIPMLSHVMQSAAKRAGIDPGRS